MNLIILVTYISLSLLFLMTTITAICVEDQNARKLGKIHVEKNSSSNIHVQCTRTGKAMTEMHQNNTPLLLSIQRQNL